MKKYLSFIIIIIALACVIFVIAKKPDQALPEAEFTLPADAEISLDTAGAEQSTPSQADTAHVFTLAEVAQHATDGDCYTAINGNVYDLTAWVHQHPGGDRNILKICGIDGTRAFGGQHGGSQEILALLAGFEIGTLAN